ncbi:MAG: iron-sulfur cluster-binding protein [Hahellaceae bacterium]|nr:iron-sulfur cluster-binding protein [Hahellaceae bacterium]MCP5168781.1 iron-sulfur cluster-binding protein [Hahellaceae bacterium]
MSQDSRDRFKVRIHEALGDTELRQNFRGAMDFLTGKRAAMFPDADALEKLRTQGASIRKRALAKLPDLLEQLENRCTSQGIRVHWAETADEANRIILGIAQQRKARLMVKGKSMVSEEIDLNHFMALQGIRCLESDMGEYIVQLAEETPSHIIMPAIHKNTAQIARLFHERIPATDYTEDVDALIGIGRKVLRENFASADIGLSGVNFAIAETGTLCLVENEGNGRMCTTVPPVHIALTGIEKVIEKLDDLPPLLTLLTRSATGQAITTYVNMISAPRQPGEKDGPEEVHLILLDNGRSGMFADAELKETLACIRCGACMNHCPVYTRIGGHAYGSTYPGPIGQVLMPRLNGLDKDGNLADACSLNGACGEACPVKIPLPDLIRRVRTDRLAPRTTSTRTQSWLEKQLWRAWLYLYQHPPAYRKLTWLGARTQALIPKRLGLWTKTRSVPLPAAETLHEQMRQHQLRRRESRSE